VVRAVALSADGERLATGGIDRRLVCYDLGRGAVAWERPHEGWVLDVAFAPDRDVLYSCDSHVLRAWAGSDGAPQRGLARSLDRVALSPDGTLLAGLQNRSRIVLFQRSADGHLVELGTCNADDTTHDLVFAPGGTPLVSVGESGEAQLWEPLRRRAHRRVLGHGRAVVAAAVVNRSFAVSADSSGQLRAIDLDAGSSRPMVRAHDGRVRTLAAAADGRTFLSASADQLWLWDASSETVRAELDLGGKGIVAAALAARANVVVAATAAGDLVHWRAGDDQPQWRSSASDHGLSALAVTADGTRAATGDEAGVVVEWDLRDGSVVRRWPATNDAWISALVFAGDGAWLAAAAADCTIRVLAPGAAAPRILYGHSRTPSALAVTGDGRLVSAGGYEFALRVWDVDAGRCLLTLTPPTAVLALSAQADDDRLLTGHLGGFVEVWDTAPGLDPGSLGPATPRLDELTPPPSATAAGRHR
jgi:WD40 repeat protein